MQTIDEINAVLEPEAGWRVELGVSPHDQSEFLRLYRKVGVTWDEKEFVASFPRDSSAGILAACGMVARHYYKLGESGYVEQIPDAEGDEQLETTIADAEEAMGQHALSTYRISHRYDIGDQAVYINRREGDVDAKRAALYCQFMCEEWFGGGSILTNLGIAALLVAFYGFRHTASVPDEACTSIDMYSDREAACGDLYFELMKDESLRRDGLKEYMAPHID